ncbi:MAG TPA: tRNA pseudouridine(55) synthase TruB [Gammaproteobacteria bacterium]|jgi:tRNA pseudouridine55 synthase|nr:tRNA pseudouridine(55) synthase TruB [Gammaproteobacteria bacterium]
MEQRESINGILLLDKHEGITSNRALQKVKRLFNAKKAGHTGSLDPIATGMLPLCFGQATKFSQFLLDSDKHYVVKIKLGEQTTTGDTEGEVIARNPVPQLTAEMVASTLATFVGKIQQIPPMYSALKHQGKPLYALARQGIEVERQPRTIEIFSLQLDALEDESLICRVHCTKGTYVRSLAEDIGKKLGCGGHVSELRRTVVSPYGEAQMYSLAELEEMMKMGGSSVLKSCLLPTETAVQVLGVARISTVSEFYLRTGQAVRVSVPEGSTLVRLLTEDSRFLGVGEVMPDGRVKPHRLL